MSSRTLWLGAATAAVALFVGGVTMLVLPEDKPRAGVSLMVSSVVAFLFVVNRAAAARRENRLNAIESRLRSFPPTFLPDGSMLKTSAGRLLMAIDS